MIVPPWWQVNGYWTTVNLRRCVGTWVASTQNTFITCSFYKPTDILDLWVPNDHSLDSLSTLLSNDHLHHKLVSVKSCSCWGRGKSMCHAGSALLRYRITGRLMCRLVGTGRMSTNGNSTATAHGHVGSSNLGNGKGQQADWWMGNKEQVGSWVWGVRWPRQRGKAKDTCWAYGE